jgi:hypothetical protein
MFELRQALTVSPWDGFGGTFRFEKLESVPSDESSHCTNSPPRNSYLIVALDLDSVELLQLCSTIPLAPLFSLLLFTQNDGELSHEILIPGVCPRPSILTACTAIPAPPCIRIPAPPE